MAYDEQGRYYFDPNDEEDMVELEHRRAEKNKEAYLDSILETQNRNQVLVQRDQVVMKEVMAEHGISEEEAVRIMQENPQWVDETREAVIRNMGKRVAEHKKSGKKAQPRTGARGGQSKPVNREALGGLQERANKGSALTEDDELSALEIVLGDDFKI